MVPISRKLSVLICAAFASALMLKTAYGADGEQRRPGGDVEGRPWPGTGLGAAQDLARLLNQADRLAKQKGDQFISSELVVLAAMDENSKLGKLLLSQGVSKKALENAINNLRGGAAVERRGHGELRGGARCEAHAGPPGACAARAHRADAPRP